MYLRPKYQIILLLNSINEALFENLIVVNRMMMARICSTSGNLYHIVLVETQR